MRIFIDIGHPAHVHYFRNFIRIMETKGHEFFITARNKEVAHKLLDFYGLEYTSRGEGKNTLFGKFLYIFKGDSVLYKYAIKFKPDIFLSFASPYAAHVSRLLGKPHITFEDTEHAKMNHRLYAPFTDAILSPSCFLAPPFSSKQLFFNSFMELCYLHPNYFTPDNKILKKLGLSLNDKYILLRFVSWKANHDIGQYGLSLNTKLKLVEELKKYAKVFISSETKLPVEIESYRLKVEPEELHDVLAFASLYIGEGSTTASECSVLGIPNIYINSLKVGYCWEQENKYQLSFNYSTEECVLDKAIEIISNADFNKQMLRNQKLMLSEKIDPTKFMVWFIENYPDSFSIIKENPDYQFRFK